MKFDTYIPCFMLLTEYKDLSLNKNLFSKKLNIATSIVHCFYCAQNCRRSESKQQLHLNAQVSKYSR